MKLAALLICVSLSAQAGDPSTPPPTGKRIPLGTAGRTSPVNQLTRDQQKAEQNEINQRLPWLDKSNYQDCGMACLYEKGNENLSLQALYIVDKVKALESEVFPDPKNPDPKWVANPGAVYTSLGVYCTEDRSRGLTGAQSCLKRYAREQMLILRKIRLGIAKNSANAGKFKGGTDLVTKIEAPIFAMIQDPDSKIPKKAQTPYVPKFKDLVAEYERDTAAMKSVVSEDYVQWASTLNAPPDPDEYVEMTQVDRDPSNPKSGKMMVVKTDGTGRPVRDTKAYRAAFDQWKLTKANTLDKDLSEVRDAIKKQPNAVRNKQELKDARDLNKVIYAQSRNDVVNAANKQTKDAGIQSKREIAFSGAENRQNLSFGNRPKPQTSAKPQDPIDEMANRDTDPVKPTANQDQFYTVVFPPSAVDKVVSDLESNPNFKK